MERKKKKLGPDWWPDTAASPADVKRVFWDESRVRHDQDDTESKDWANSEPDPDAP
jgi:hypothetical protein